MKVSKKRMKSDHVIGEQQVLTYGRESKPIIEGNLYHIFPPLTKEEKLGLSETEITKLNNIVATLPSLNEEYNHGEVDKALDQYEELEEIIIREQQKNRKNEKRIVKLTHLKDCYRKRVTYLETLLDDKELTESTLIRKAKTLGRLQREFRLKNDAESRQISNLLNLDVNEQIDAQDQILVAYLCTLFNNIKSKRAKLSTRLIKKQRLLSSIEILRKANHSKYIGPMWNLMGKTAYLRTHSKSLVQYLSTLGASGGYSTMLQEIKELPSIDDIIPETGACIVILDNCQNDGKKLYLDRIENEVDIKVVTAFVTIHLKNNNSQHIDGKGPWINDNSLKEHLETITINNEQKNADCFQRERKEFIRSFLFSNHYQKKEDEFVDTVIKENEVDITDANLKGAVYEVIKSKFDDSGYKEYSEARTLFSKIQIEDNEEESGDEDSQSDGESNSSKNSSNDCEIHEPTSSDSKERDILISN
jgi:hypothetical protein